MKASKMALQCETQCRFAFRQPQRRQRSHVPGHNYHAQWTISWVVAGRYYQVDVDIAQNILLELDRKESRGIMTRGLSNNKCPVPTYAAGLLARSWRSELLLSGLNAAV